MSTSVSGVLSFGAFRLDPKSGELRRDGAPVKLQLQPAKVLLLLAERPGVVLTREEIEERIWGKEYIVGAENLRFCIRQIRAALGDDAENPRYIETLPKVGYRFIAQAEKQIPSAEAPITAICEWLGFRHQILQVVSQITSDKS